MSTFRVYPVQPFSWGEQIWSFQLASRLLEGTVVHEDSDWITIKHKLPPVIKGHPATHSRIPKRAIEYCYSAVPAEPPPWPGEREGDYWPN